MALVPYTITVIERDTADAAASGKQVVVGAVCSMFLQPADTAALLYDNADGDNGSTAKTTNSSGQVTVWVDAGDYRVSVNGNDSFISLQSGGTVPSDTVTETQTLIALQTTVTLASITTTRTAFYINGPSVDNGRLVLGVDYTLTSTAEIELATDYPAGTLITAVQNDGTEALFSDLQVYDTVADMALATPPLGIRVKTNGYYTPNDGGGADYLIVASGTGTDDGGSYIDLALNQAELISSSRVDLKVYGGRENQDCKVSFNAALANPNVTYIKIPDGAILGRHTVTSPTIKIIEGGDGVTFDPTVDAAGLYAFEGEYIEIFGFTNTVLEIFPLSGGVFAEGHVFFSLESLANIGTLIIRDNSATGGKIGIAANFENSRTLRSRCEIYRNNFDTQNGGTAGTGYGIQYANENNTGEAYIARNTVTGAGRHSFYLARNKGGGQISFEYNKAINHRETAPTQGAEVRSAIQITRCSNVKGIGNEIDGFYDSALFIAEEGEDAGELGATDITLHATTIKTPKNTIASIYIGFITPSVASFTENVNLNGITFESDASRGGVNAPLFNYSWGRNINISDVSIEYKGQTSGVRVFTLVGNSTANSDYLSISNVRLAVKDSTGNFEIIRLVSPIATENINLGLTDINVIELSGGATVSDYSIASTVTNPSIKVMGFSYPAASTALPKPIETPSLGIEAELVHDFPSIAAGAQAGVNVTVTGALLGDFAVASFSLNLNGLTIHAAVIGSNTVAVFLVNNTPAPIDLGSGIVRVKVIQNHS